MTRPNRNHDQLLIETAKRLFPKVGASGMSLKMIADKAGVNVGMFHYHFKTKANFIRKVLESLADDARQETGIKVPESETSIERLRAVLNGGAQAFYMQRKLVLSMCRDLLNQDPDVAAFMIANSERMLKSLRPLVEECQRDGYIDTSPAVEQIVAFCLGAVRTPIVVAAALEHLPKKLSAQLPEASGKLSVDEAIAERVEMALRGIAPVRGKP